MNIVILIPAYQPGSELLDFIKTLSVMDFPKLVIVDDGSRADLQGIFEDCAKIEKTTVLHHEHNMGKGRALKTGLEYIAKNLPDCIGVITADSDGQHLPEDIVKIAQAMENDARPLYLGSRFADWNAVDEDNNAVKVPFKSKVGNFLTRNMFFLSSGVKIKDTQTGLRGIPTKDIPDLLEIEGDRYEFELNMLFHYAEHKIPMIEIPIKTIYINQNSGSHFHPVRDSFRIYKNFLKYIFTAFSSFLIDYAIFAAIILILNHSSDVSAVFGNRSVIQGDNAAQVFANISSSLDILAANVIARVFSSIYNFLMNKKFVFKKKGKTASSAGKYVLTVVATAICSYIGIMIVSMIPGLSLIIAKPIIELILFIINYYVQRRFVFK